MLSDRRVDRRVELTPAILDDADPSTVLQCLSASGAPPGVAPDQVFGDGRRERNKIDVLVVDDEPLVREFSATILSAGGYVVAEATDGLDAMRKLEELPEIRLVFTDIVMPGVNGIVLADMAKRRRPDLKILYATGYRDIARAKDQAGILHGPILEKPYRAFMLRSEIERLLSNAP